MAKTKNLNELDSIAANNAKILALSPTGAVGYVSGVFNSTGNLQEVDDLEYVTPSQLEEHVSEFTSTKQDFESRVSELESSKASIESGIKKNSDDIKEHLENYEILSNKVSANTSKLESLQISDIVGLQNELNSALSESDIASLREEVSNSSETVSGFSDRIQSIENDLQTAKSDSSTAKEEATKALESTTEALEETTRITTRLSNIQIENLGTGNLEYQLNELSKSIETATNDVKSEIEEKIESLSVNDIVSLQSVLDNKADKSDVPSTDDFASSSELKNLLSTIENLQQELNIIQEKVSALDISTINKAIADASEAKASVGTKIGQSELDAAISEIENTIDTKISSANHVSVDELDNAISSNQAVQDIQSKLTELEALIKVGDGEDVSS